MSAVRPTDNTGVIVDEFIRYATQHLTTVTGIISTTSLYPPLGTPGPGIINWTGYTVPPAAPSIPIGQVDTSAIEMTPEQEAIAERASQKGADLNAATAAALSGVEYTGGSSGGGGGGGGSDSGGVVSLPVDKLPVDGVEKIPNYKTSVKVPPEIVVAMRKYGVGRSPLERAHFLAQCAHESGGFIYREELASGAAYEGRRDLGNTQPGDGVRYKGRGYIQLTGRANYTKFGPVAGGDFVGNPRVVAQQYYADTACLFWKSNSLGPKCVNSSIDTIKVVTKRINGGYNGLNDRVSRFAVYWRELQRDPTLWA
jgi:putative chitinase